AMPSSIATDDDGSSKIDEDQTGSPSPIQDVHDGDAPDASTPVRKNTTSKPMTPNNGLAHTKSSAKKPEPTLLTDFLLGRPSPGRQRRKSLDVVKAEMKRASVNKVPPPGGVKERVKQWQKNNAGALVEDPAEAPSEPEDLLEHVDEDSVNEDDRVRIKMSNTKPPPRRKSRPQRRASLKGRPNHAPRKRVVSDEHWRNKRSTPPKTKQAQDLHPGSAIPKNFVKVTAMNPPVDTKIKDWIKRAETPNEYVREDPPTPKQGNPDSAKAPISSNVISESTPKASADSSTVESKIKDWSKRSETSEGGLQKPATPTRKKARDLSSPAQSTPKSSKPSSGSGIPKDFLKTTAMNPPVEKKIKDWVKRTESDEVEHEQATPSKSNSLKEPPSSSSESKAKRRKDLSSGDAIPKDFLKATAMNPPVDAKIKDWINRAEAAEVNGDRTKKKRSRRKSKEQAGKDEATDASPPRSDSVDDETEQTPVKLAVHRTRSHKPRASNSRNEKDKVDDPIGLKTPKQKYKTPHPVSDFESDRKSSVSEREDVTSCTTPSPPEKARRRHSKKFETISDEMSEIPFGQSAFSVLDLPLGAEAGTIRRPKPQRNGSLSVPKVLKKVYNVVHETVDPPKMEINQPPSIESWLNQTTDPFVDRPSSSHSRDKDSGLLDSQGVDGSLDQGKVKSDRRRSVSKRETEADVIDEDMLPRAGRSSENSPLYASGLRRSPATRHSSTPVKPSKKLPFKDALFDAFKGESAVHGSNPLAKPQWKEERVLTNRDIEDDRSVSAEEVSSRNSSSTELSAIKEDNEMKYESRPRRNRQTSSPNTYRLSTILSVETMRTETPESEMVPPIAPLKIRKEKSTKTAPTGQISRRGATRGSSRRRLAKHSDLLSVLSLPDSGEPGGTRSIKSARSIRTKRTDPEKTTARDLLKELDEDEAKYARELRTVVDGVIPVLLNMTLSKSDSDVSASSPNSGVSMTAEDKKKLTQDICRMGVALEKLKMCHKRVPLVDIDALPSWLDELYEIYEDYLSAWRMEFQNVVVNLAPNSRADQSLLDGMPRNADGDIVNSNGERVDVAFLLKRPLVRVKYLSKLTKGLSKLKPSEGSDKLVNRYEKLHNRARQRIKEETARLEDQAANNTDATRARDLRTLALIEDIRIDRTRQVCAKDFFSLDLAHSNGQRIECRVEVILRDKPSDIHDSGDLLICKVEEFSQYLLFPPITRDRITVCRSGEIGHILFTIQGRHGTKEWQETLDLSTDDLEAVTEWLDMLGSSPSTSKNKDLDPPATHPATPRKINSIAAESPRTPSAKDIEIPIGERRRKDEPRTSGNVRQRTRDLERLANKQRSQELPSSPEVKRPRPTRYHGQPSISSKAIPEEQEEPGRHSTSTSRQTQSHSDDDTVKESQESSVLSEDVPGAKYRSRTKEQPAVSRDGSPDLARDDGASPPPPPQHKTPPSSAIKNTPQLTTPTGRARTRRTSSPLKHEYQPSDGSGTSSASEASDSDDDRNFDTSSISDSSEDEELEAADVPGTLPAFGMQTRGPSPMGSFYSTPEDSLAPSNSASQGPYHRVPRKPSSSSYNTGRLKARISSWSNKHGRWEDLYPEECLIVVNPGLIEAFEMPSGYQDDEELYNSLKDERPLVALVLTPLVSLRQSNAIDIEIKSPPTHMSRLKWDGPVRYRAADINACRELYQAIHRSRLDNPIYKKLEEERMLNSYGGHSYEAAVATNRRRSWFGRRRSYRASTRAPEGSVTSTPNSISSSAFSVLKRLTGNSRFDIARSSIDDSQANSGYNSAYTSSSGSSTSGITPPRTPTDPSLAGTSISHIINRSSQDLKIRLYILATRSKWDDLGSALLTVSQPAPGMRQASALYQGVERRIVVRSQTKNPEDSVVLLDVVLGGRCFQRVGRTGVLVNVWQDISGPNGEIGMIGASGGVSGRTRKWLFQSGSASDADWIYGLVAVGR
ncbi:hypothetical protein DH86_00000869, partial [Scytalidium sp. 3C]